ncbi:QUIRKY protein [Spatholobus suberectus]|nr:QUIRKY protein [Spatholobus suberectus]
MYTHMKFVELCTMQVQRRLSYLNMGIAGLAIKEGKLTRRKDLVEQMEFLFVRVVRIRNLPHTLDFYVEIKLGDLKATTLFFASPEWNRVFAFEKDKIDESVSNVLVLVKDKRLALKMPDVFLGRVQFSLIDVPRRVPQESSFAPQWYKLMNLFLMLGVHDATRVSGDAVGYTRSKVYISPTLWYLRVNVIQAQDLDLFRLPSGSSHIFVQVDLGSQRLRTKLSKSPKPLWNEELVFVAQEPFSDTLVLSVEQGTLAERISLGKHVLHLKGVDKRLDDEDVNDRWYNLGRLIITETSREVRFAGKLNARISLDGAYHVMDEPSEFCSDFRPSSKTLWNSSIGVLEVVIQKATDLVAMKSGARTDAYCVAKYGSKWVRTRTIVDSLSPKWNEQHTWEVYEPFTVITIAVFDNNQLNANTRAREARDAIMGKIRIRLSTLDNGKVYTHSYPLVGLHPSGVKKMGEIHLAVRFSFSFVSPLKMYQSYMLPLLPRHHHVFPLSPSQLLTLRNQPAHIIAQRLSRAEPPLRKEVVYYMLDFRSSLWSKRKAVANFNRIMSLIGDFVAFWKWLEDIKNWKKPVVTLLFNFVCFLMLFFFPKRILPLVILYLLCVVLKRYLKRPKHPCHTDATLSGAHVATAEDLVEELDRFPTQLGGEPLTRRYDRLRIVATNAQKLINDLATLGEKLQALFTWRDPRATTIFLMFCVVGFLVTVTVPARVVIFIWITYYLRHPRFRDTLPSVPENFIKRMPCKQVSIL